MSAILFETQMSTENEFGMTQSSASGIHLP